MELLVFHSVYIIVLLLNVSPEISVGLHQVFNHGDALDHPVGEGLTVDPVEDAGVLLDLLRRHGSINIFNDLFSLYPGFHLDFLLFLDCAS